MFNPLKARLVIQMNNRDHRKICVIDGKIGFVGGINLADEYINAYEKYGHWKDTAVMHQRRCRVESDRHVLTVLELCL